jgi:hypothetical protein
MNLTVSQSQCRLSSSPPLEIVHRDRDLNLLPRFKRRQPEVRTTSTPKCIPSITTSATRRLDSRLQFVALWPDLLNTCGGILDDVGDIIISFDKEGRCSWGTEFFVFQFLKSTGTVFATIIIYPRLDDQHVFLTSKGVLWKTHARFLRFL